MYIYIYILLYYIILYIYIYIYIILVSIVEGDTRVPFSLSNTPMSWGGRYFFSWIAPLYP